MRRQDYSLRNLNWATVIGIGGFHILALFALIPAFFSWSGLAVFFFLYWLTGGVGITAGFHRLLTHKSFKTYKWVEYIMTLFGCLALQGSPPKWVGTHRIHHAHSDDEDDPHTPNHGFNWAHIWWIFWEDGGVALKRAGDILADPFHRFLSRWFWIFQIPLIALLFFTGWALGGSVLGISWVVWGGALRTVVVHHSTWFVNSASHTWGYQTYKTGDRSKNNWWVSFLAFGEGWHNNHHYDQRSVRHGFRWWELDTTYWLIKLMSCVGLAWDLKMPSKGS